jgi:dTDP-4-dehydrorhamnose 3,5-epimerase/reductase
VVEFSKDLSARQTGIPGLVLYQLPVHGDSRGWFKENWQREKMSAIGLPDFGPVQNNVSFNDAVGTTRGIHAEPWDKYVSVATGRIFGAWVDLREGATFGTVFTAEIDPSVAIFVPRGVGNSYQTLEENSSYVYLVNDHWSADAQSQYTFLNLSDESAAISWPIPISDAEVSEKDKAHPRLVDVIPMAPKKTLILGANGQVGRALGALLPNAFAASRDTFDVTNANSFDSFPWSQYDTVINAAAYTAVDHAETAEGRKNAWAINVAATAALARIATKHRITLVHISSDYVFDGSFEEHFEDEPYSPIGVYGQTKAAADAIVSLVPSHYILRTSWVIGDGTNFVRTMKTLAERDIDPTVVDDQWGRLSFADDIAAAAVHLLTVGAESGVYNVSNTGAVQTWAEIARTVFELTGHDASRVSGVSTAEYFEGKAVAPRPLHSALNLQKLRATGFVPRDSLSALAQYLNR